MKKKYVQAEIPENIYRRLEKAVSKTGQPKAAIVRNGILKQLKEAEV